MRRVVDARKENRTEPIKEMLKKRYMVDLVRLIHIHDAPAADTALSPGIVYTMNRHSLCGRKL